MGMSLKRLIMTILAVMSMIFFLIEKVSALDVVCLLTIMVAVYLLIMLILGAARKSDSIGAGGQITLDVTFAVLLLLYNIPPLGRGGQSGLLLGATIMNIVVGSLLLIFAIF